MLAPGGRVAHPGDHDAARPDARDPRHLHLDQQVHLPRRLPALGRRSIDEITREHTALRLTDRLAIGQHYAETLRLWDEAFLAARERGARRSASTRRSCGCGTSTWSTRGPASPPATSTSTSSPSERTDVRDRRTDGSTACPALEDALRPFLGGDLPVRLKAWDGSEAGPADAPLVVLSSVDAVRRLLRHPGELGAAQAYVTGELDVPGDLDEALTHAFAVGRERGLSGGRPLRAGAARRGAHRRRARRARPAAGGARVAGPDPRPAAQPGCATGSAISHHYDLSNEFYALILEPQMAYSCGYSLDDPTYSLEEAQHAKLDLVCRKLGLEPGHDPARRRLRLGLAVAARRRALRRAGHRRHDLRGAEAVRRRGGSRERGLEDRVDDPAPGLPRRRRASYDAVSSIEMGEHVGEDNYPTYAEVLHRLGAARRPGAGPADVAGAGTPARRRPVHRVVHRARHAHAAGRRDRRAPRAGRARGARRARAARALRATVAGWLDNFEPQPRRVVELVGEEVVRVWRLYLVGGAMAFRDGRMGVDQILMVRPGARARCRSERDW